MHGTHNVKWMLNTLQWEKVQLDKWFELVLGSFLVILHLRYTKIRTLQHVVSWRVFFWRSHGKLLIFTEGFDGVRDTHDSPPPTHTHTHQVRCHDYDVLLLAWLPFCKGMEWASEIPSCLYLCLYVPIQLIFPTVYRFARHAVCTLCHSRHHNTPSLTFH